MLVQQQLFDQPNLRPGPIEILPRALHAVVAIARQVVVQKSNGLLERDDDSAVDQVRGFRRRKQAPRRRSISARRPLPSIDTAVRGIGLGDVCGAGSVDVALHSLCDLLDHFRTYHRYDTEAVGVHLRAWRLRLDGAVPDPARIEVGRP